MTSTTLRVHQLPVPVVDPPYDDELGPDDRLFDYDGRQGALALAFVLPSGLPVEPAPAADVVLRLVPPPEPTFDAQPTPRAALPDPRGFAARLVQAMVEVVAGGRPVAQLIRWTNETVYAQLTERVRRLASGGAPGLRGVVAGRVRSLHITEPLDGVAEITAVVHRAGRASAVAVRLEGLDGRWQCTAVAFG